MGEGRRDEKKREGEPPEPGLRPEKKKKGGCFFYYEGVGTHLGGSRWLPPLGDGGGSESRGRREEGVMLCSPLNQETERGRGGRPSKRGGGTLLIRKEGRRDSVEGEELLQEKKKGEKTLA